MKRYLFDLLIIFGLISIASADFIRDNDKEVVIDSETNLMWQDSEDCVKLEGDFGYALNYCENLTLAGYDDWRLPNINELEGLTYRDRINPAIDSAFVNVLSKTGGAFYWSSTHNYLTPILIWSIDFYYGSGGSPNQIESEYIRCVRENR